MSWLLAAAAASLCVGVFWLLALGMRVLLSDSTIDPAAGVVAGLLVAFPVYRAVWRRLR
jgi:hypothetical protein